jgi:cardiolipin synthase (CMP-forming)
VKYIPNIISILRILLVIPTVWFILRDEYTRALILFFVAGASDGLDGLLARRFGWTTRLGGFLDPIGDKLLMTAIYFMLGYKLLLPLWLVALVIGRDALILGGAIAYRLVFRDISMSPLLISKINTACQVSLALVMLFSLSSLPMAAATPAWLPDALIYIVTTTTILSGLAYVVIWSCRAHRQIRRQA